MEWIKKLFKRNPDKISLPVLRTVKLYKMRIIPGDSFIISEDDLIATPIGVRVLPRITLEISNPQTNYPTIYPLSRIDWIQEIGTVQLL